MVARVKPKQRGTPEEHLRYMLKYGLKWTDAAGVGAAAEALLPHLSASGCPRYDGDCRPGACNCDGAHDALKYAIKLYDENQTVESARTSRLA